jgi:1-phosphofructokinase
MIYTVTFNPALDYVIRVDHFTLGAVNRTEQESIYYGGKGLNVSAVLSALGYENTALGFVAGFTGEEIEQGVKDLGFQADFIHVEKGLSRINVKLKSQEETEINGMGPEITAEDVKQLLEKLDRLTAGDVLVLSGSIPKSIDDDIYERIMESLDGRGVRIVVDATKDLLINVLPYHPFLIKPNNHELGEMFGVTLHSPEEITYYGKRLQEKGAGNVLISMAGDGAILITEEGEVFRMGVPKGIVKNSVGAGDSMVAGFIAGYLENGSYKHALRLGSAAGSASAFSDGLAGKEDIMRLYEELSKEGF